MDLCEGMMSKTAVWKSQMALFSEAMKKREEKQTKVHLPR